MTTEIRARSKADAAVRTKVLIEIAGRTPTVVHGVDKEPHVNCLSDEAPLASLGPTRQAKLPCRALG